MLAPILNKPKEGAMSKGKVQKRTIAELRAEFWSAPDNAELPREVTAAGICRSIGWMEWKAIAGDGIPYRKVGRRVLYCKTDVLAWLEANSQRVHSTSEYKTARGRAITAKNTVAHAAQYKPVRSTTKTQAAAPGDTRASRPSPKRGRRARRKGSHA
jgi:hypothetical protein